MLPPPRVSNHLTALLRADLTGWTPETVRQQLGDPAHNALERGQTTPGRHRLAGNSDAAAMLTRIYLLEETVSADDIAAAHPNLGICGAIQLGTITESRARYGDGYRAAIKLEPHGRWWVASDQGTPTETEHVIGIGGATRSLLQQTPRERVGSALDMGAGCGIQAMYLSTHATHVTATDISERACAYARFNMELNNIHNVTVRCGSLFEPVSGETFDLIVTNPPFVITPRNLRGRGKLEYRDGGMERDQLVAHVISVGPSHLKPGGHLQMIGNWETRRGQTHWADPVRAWLETATDAVAPDGLRAWVAQRDSVDITQYAELWLRDAQRHHQWADDYQTWIEDFESAEVERIGMGAVAVRRDPNVEGLMLLAEERSAGEIPDGKHVKRTLDHLQLPDNWQQWHLRQHDDLWEQRLLRPGSSDVSVIKLALGAETVRVSSTTAALVGASDGELSCEQIIVALAALTGSDQSDLAEQVSTEIPTLLRAGMVDIVTQ